uniref:(northern house mosquito) hypothetical protein n=1 Tax=Culex pipiens TaxID=7175 RepID=A0A8D8P5J8_CULPI
MKKRSRNRKNRNQSWSSQRRWFVQTRASCSAIIVKRMTSRMLAASGLTRIAVAMRDVSEALLSEKKDYSTRRCIYRRTRRLCIRSIIVVKTRSTSRRSTTVSDRTFAKSSARRSAPRTPSTNTKSRTSREAVAFETNLHSWVT